VTLPRPHPSLPCYTVPLFADIPCTLPHVAAVSNATYCCRSHPNVCAPPPDLTCPGLAGRPYPGLSCPACICLKYYEQEYGEGEGEGDGVDFGEDERSDDEENDPSVDDNSFVLKVGCACVGLSGKRFSSAVLSRVVYKKAWLLSQENF